jgi:polyhydroxybutyrate depolymerase
VRRHRWLGLALAGLLGAAAASGLGVGIGGIGGIGGAAPAVLSAERGRALPPGLVERTLSVSGVRRHYLLYVPPGLTRPAPLVVALHGLHLSARWMAVHTGLPAAAARQHVILALPDALSGAWNDGRLGTHGPADDRFVLDLVADLTRAGHPGSALADPQRVTVAGFSNGAEMALVLAARHPATFAAVVSISGQLLAVPGAARPLEPVPAYFTHGTADRVQPYGGRPAGGRLRPALLSEEETVRAFATAAGAGPPRERTALAVAGRPRVTEEIWPAGARRAEVVLYRLVGGGHVWPGSASTCGQVVCGSGLSASTLVMQVARTHVR